MNDLLITVAQIIQYAIPILFAITLHEVSHGWVALKLGDATAKLQGRLSINPIKHIDPIGTVLVPAILYYLGGFIFGWAKPVPITWQNLNNPKRDMAFVAIAGPLANFIMMFFWATAAKTTLLLIKNSNNEFAQYLLGMSKIGILINAVLMVLNLIPIPPLDGSRIITSFVSPSMARVLANIEIFGFLILVILLASGILSAIIFPIIVYIFHFVTYLFALPQLSSLQ